MCNPPYGERLKSEQGLAALYSVIGSSMQRFAPAKLYLISANPDLLHRLRLNRQFKKDIKNGPISCLFAGFDISSQIVNQSDQSDQDVLPVIEEETAVVAKPVGPKLRHSQVDNMKPLVNRLIKNAKHIRRWAKRNDVTCYRLYDADLPEFSFALDVYQSEIYPEVSWYHLQEYQAPKTIEPEVAAERIEIAKAAVINAFGIDESHLFCKLRQRQRGRKQYEKQDNQGELFQVREGQASLLVNLSDYLDSGLFLDHRMTRQRVLQMAKGKTLLNLFCYTGSVGVQAALGGATKVVNVDMSATYLKWAEENHSINQLADRCDLEFLRANAVELLERPNRFSLPEQFDLIFLDPPSFSNSAKMQDTLDIQRDHEVLIEQSMKLLDPKGVLIFSTNRKGFKLGEGLSDSYDLVDITRETIPDDFKRRASHKCWEIRQRATG